MPDPAGNKAARLVGIIFLTLCTTAAAALLLFGIGMEGMRHGHPSGFDPYYFEFSAPTIFFGSMLLIATVRMSRAALIKVSTIAGIFALGFAVIADRDSGIIVVGFIIAAVIAAGCVKLR